PSPLHDYEYTKNSLHRTHRWEKDSLDTHKKLELQKQYTDPQFNEYPYPHPQYLFGIPHGGCYEDLRVESAKYISSLDFAGYSVGGALGDTKKQMHQILDWINPHLEPSRPRHLLGIADIDDLFEAIERGFDMFDCVTPTRIARNGALFISPRNNGNKQNKFRLIIANSQYKNDPLPIDPGCACYTCQNFSRSYLRHLFMAKELLAYRLATLHNLHFILRLTTAIRTAILNDQFPQLKKQWLE
ncbi:MAG: tRNA-guanine transglycosylase, partial [bacterium]|nr:tRNA-guanine transglycosylase [bacterium]